MGCSYIFFYTNYQLSSGCKARLIFRWFSHRNLRFRWRILQLPSGKLTVRYWTWPFLKWIYPSNMVIFQCVMLVYQMVAIAMFDDPPEVFFGVDHDPFDDHRIPKWTRRSPRLSPRPLSRFRSPWHVLPRAGPSGRSRGGDVVGFWGTKPQQRFSCGIWMGFWMVFHGYCQG